jgi:hypothetical protein
MPPDARGIPIERIRTAAYRIPTDLPESDGTLEWGAVDASGACSRKAALAFVRDFAARRVA